MQGYIGNNSHGIPQSGVDNLLVKRMALDRQRSLPSPYPYWPGRDSAPMISKSEIAPESTLLPPATEILGQPPQPQNAELMSIFQGLSDRSSSGVNVAGWPNFNVQGGSDLLQGKIDMHPDKSFPPQAPLGIPQQRLQPQNQPAFPNLFSQVVDNTQGIPAQEQLLSSGLPQDPQLLNMLQQQYLLHLHSQAPAPAQQISLLDKLLLLKQQQKQEEQQMLLRQQQQLLSQVLSEHQGRQHFADPSFGQLQVSPILKANASIDPRLQPSQEMFPVGSNMPVPNIQSELTSNLVNLPSQVNQNINYNASTEASSLQLPHQMFENINNRKGWGATLAESIDVHQDSLPASTLVESSPLPEGMSKPMEEPVVHKSTVISDVTQILDKPEEKPFRAEATADSAPLEIPEIPVPLPPPGATEIEKSNAEHPKDVVQSSSAVQDDKVERDRGNDELSTLMEVKSVEAREIKKASEKKSKKQKSSKAQASEQAKAAFKTLSLHQAKQPEKDVVDNKLETEIEAAYETSPAMKTIDNKEGKSGISSVEVMESQQIQMPVAQGASGNNVEPFKVQVDSEVVESVAAQNTQIHPGQRAWKPAPGFKAKSLLEIQLEEQRKARTDVVSEMATPVNSLSSATPWAGVVANSEPKISREAHGDSGSSELNVVKPENSLNTKSKKSQLHDLLAEEVLSKSSERNVDVPDSVLNMSSPQIITTVSESVDDDNFIEAKDSKKSRKKSSKSKGAGSKVSVPVTSVDVPISSSPAEKVKTSKSLQQEKEVLPAIPSGPSLGDFVPWKGEPANPSPSPAWSTESGRAPKPASLRDIQKEQGKRVAGAQHTNQIPTPQKSQPTQATRNSGPSWSISGSSPSKAASPIQVNPQASQLRHKADDDLFWGPIDQTKQETKQYDTFSLYLILYVLGSVYLLFILLRYFCIKDSQTIDDDIIL